MQTLILNGSPRKKGNTDHLTALIAEGLEQEGTEVHRFRLADMDIHPCIGCGHCEKEGICIFKDDMVTLYQEITAADRVLIASPIYFYALSAQAKTCIDRCQALWSRKYILKQPISDKPDRKGYLVSVSATKGDRIFEGAALCARYVFDAMDVDYAGDLLYAGADARGAVKEHPDYPDKIAEFIGQVLQT